MGPSERLLPLILEQELVIIGVSDIILRFFVGEGPSCFLPNGRCTGGDAEGVMRGKRGGGGFIDIDEDREGGRGASLAELGSIQTARFRLNE